MVTETFENRPVSMNGHNNLRQIEEHMYILQNRTQIHAEGYLDYRHYVS